jgi:hypothetical protein
MILMPYCPAAAVIINDSSLEHHICLVNDNFTKHPAAGMSAESVQAVAAVAPAECRVHCWNPFE